MAQSPFCSIVMPVYRSRPYLKDAVGSILAQTLADWELILVDDASPDASGALCDELAARDGRIAVIHLKENRGQGRARNEGMARAAGRYLLFMDSDDRAEPDLLEQARRSLESHPAQIVAFGLTEENYDARGALRFCRTIVPSPNEMDSARSVRAEVLRWEKATLFGYVWNKLYERALLEKRGLRFEKAALNEDFLFNAALIPHIERVNALALPLYRYARRPDGSLTHRFVPDYFPLHLRRVQILYDLHSAWGLLSSEVKTELGGIFLRYILSAVQQNCDPRSRMSHARRTEWLRELFSSPLYRELKPFIRPESRMMTLLARPLLAEHPETVLMQARGVYFVKKYCPVLFSQIKYRR